MRRRDFLSALWASCLPAFAGCATRLTGSAAGSASRRSTAIIYVPGYRPGRAIYKGQPLIDDPRFNGALPKGYDGPITMLSRVGGPGEPVRRAVFPISRGHGVSVHEAVGFFGGFNSTAMLTFDPDSLDMISLVRPHREGWVGGGHAVFTPDGRHLLVTERQARRPYSGRADGHFGMVAVREARSLKVVDSYSCHGIAPHQIGVLADGKHVAIANYGSTAPPAGTGDSVLPHMVEPCVTILELESGRLVHKILAPDVENQVRHLAAHSLERTMVIQAREGEIGEDLDLMLGREDVYVRDFTSKPNTVYLPAPVLQLTGAAGTPPQARPISAADPLLMRHGLSIVYEPRFDQFIATFPTANCFMIFDGAGGGITRIVRTEPLGLSYPSGVALHTDGRHYLITGSWRGLLVFRRGSHELNREAMNNVLFFGHSHIAVM